ncbi:MAG: hypothetical protein ACAH80_14910 [Alphaproteobacteria bacterium]
MKNLMHVAMICICAFAGGVFSDQFLRPAQADINERGVARFYDSRRIRMDQGVSNNQFQQNIYGEDGKLRLQFGTYTGEVRENEKGLPTMTLYDNEGLLRLLFRLDGPTQGPLIIMKDKKQRNRVIMGLDIWDEDEEPFLAIWDKDGKQQNIYGDFKMKPL